MSDSWRRRVRTLLGLWLPPVTLWASPGQATLPADTDALSQARQPEPLVFDNLWERQELQRYAAHRSHSSHSSHSSHYSSRGGGYYSPPAQPYNPPPPSRSAPVYQAPRLFDPPSTVNPRRDTSPPTTAKLPSADELTRMVRTVQLALIARGYGLWSADGKLGPETRTALKQYQQDSGFAVTGRLDARTLGSLGIVGQ
jgi:His-Xaa-Ser repeat protein HxsA